MAISTSITTIPFYGAEIIVQRGETPGATYVAMKPVVEGMGLSWQPQHNKLLDHPVLSEGVTEIVIPSAGGPQAMTALPLNRVHFWLATMHPKKIKDPHVRERVLVYQAEAADALFERFFGRALAKPEADTGAIGGVVKGVVAKHGREVMLPEIRSMVAEALTELMLWMAKALLSESRYQIAEGMTAGEVIALAGYPNGKGLRGLSKAVGNRW